MSRRKRLETRIRWAIAAEGLTPHAKLVLLVLASQEPVHGHHYNRIWHGSLTEPCGMDDEQVGSCLAELVTADKIEWDGERRGKVWLKVRQTPPLDNAARARAYAALVEQYGEWCAYCGTSDGPFHVDHKIPRSRGGGNHMDNLWLACGPCNLEKAALSHHEWSPRRDD